MPNAAWRGGVDPDRVRTELERAVASSTREFETARSSPHPIPRSLALALALGEKPDERVSQAMVKLLQDRADPGQGQKPEELAAARTKQAAEFQKATAGASEFALAWAVFHAAAMVVHPTPADLVFYDGLLRGRQSDPLYIETLLLRRLADRGVRRVRHGVASRSGSTGSRGGSLRRAGIQPAAVVLTTPSLARYGRTGASPG